MSNEEIKQKTHEFAAYVDQPGLTNEQILQRGADWLTSFAARARNEAIEEMAQHFSLEVYWNPVEVANYIRSLKSQEAQ